MSHTFTILILFAFAILIKTQPLPPHLNCRTLPECLQIIQQLNQENLDLQSQLDGVPLPSDDDSTTEQERVVLPQPGASSEVQDSFLTTQQDPSYHSFEVPTAGVFYLSVQNLENGTSSVYLSSTCSCNTTSSVTNPTSDENCMASVAKMNYLTETAPGACTIYYAIESPAELSAVMVWFYPFEELPVNVPTQINLPFPNYARTFAYNFGPVDFPTTFYLDVTSVDPSAPTNIYLTSNCDDACFQGPSFTQFPSQATHCWAGTQDGSNTVFNFYVTRSCSIFYTLESPMIGNITATMSIYKTEPLKNATSTTLNFPLRNQYRTFSQDIGLNEVFYINSYAFETTTDTHLYMTSNCTLNCADSTNYTIYPTANQHCWDTPSKYYFVVASPCRIYYSISSSVAGPAADIRATMYPLLNLPLSSLYAVNFPFVDSYRWFYTDVDPASSDRMVILGQRVDNRIDSRIFMSTNCTLSCFQSNSYTHYPTYSSNCGSGVEGLQVNITATEPCRVYYAIYSSHAGTRVYVTPQLGALP